MISWITTVGWSPFAVINPFWAHCKESKDIPTRIHLIHTKNLQFKKNLEICKSYINEILRVYLGNNYGEIVIKEHEIESDQIVIYADNLRNIINEEISLKPKKIILDMTPGRKYMSAINMYYGLSNTDMPIKVYYLHLEESKYNDLPYPLTPIIKNELIDIIDSTQVFSRDFQSIISKELSTEDKLIEISENVILNDRNSSEIKDYLILLAVAEDFISLTGIRKFLFIKKINLQGNELRQIIKKLEVLGFVDSDIIDNRSTEFTGYRLNDLGRTKLKELSNQILNVEV